MAYGTISSNATPASPIVVTPPSGIADNDFLVVAEQSDSLSGGTETLPSGFTAVTGTPVACTADGGQSVVGTKIASSESGNYSCTWQFAQASIGFVLRLTGIDTATGIHKFSVSTQSTLQNPGNVASAAWSGGGNTTEQCTLVYIVFLDNHTSGTVTMTEPSGFTERLDSSDGTFYHMYVATQDNVAAGSSGVFTGAWTGTGQTGWTVVALAIKETGGGGGGPAIPVLMNQYRQRWR